MTTTTVPTCTDDLLAEIERLSEKATQGKWWIDSHGHRMSTEDGMKTVFIASDIMGKATRHKETGNLSHWPNDWDASYIAACSPENIRALLARLRAAEADAGRYRFLKDQGHFRAMSMDMGGNHTWVGMGRCVGNGPTVDAAIDSSMQEARK